MAGRKPSPPSPSPEPTPARSSPPLPNRAGEEVGTPARASRRRSTGGRGRGAKTVEVGGRDGLELLTQRAAWIDEVIVKLTEKDMPQAALLKVLLSEYREYMKLLIAAERSGHVDQGAAGAARVVDFNWSALSMPEIEELERLRLKLMQGLVE